MKKLLSLLGTIAMTASVGSTIVACDSINSKTNVNSPILNQKYGLSTHFFNEEQMFLPINAEEIFTNQMQGYVNPLLNQLLNRNVKNIDREYAITGLNKTELANAVEKINKSITNSEAIRLSGITVKAKSSSRLLRGATTLENVLIIKGWDIASVFDTELAAMSIPIAGFEPTLSEVLTYLNQMLKSDVAKKVEQLHPGHLYFSDPTRGKINIYGQGAFYNSVSIAFLSALATDIAEVLTETDLGDIKFTHLPSEADVINKLNQVNDLALTMDDVRIDGITTTGGTVHGLWHYKGQVDLSWTQAKIDLGSLVDRNLGHLNHQPSPQEVVNLINKKNGDLGLLKDDVTMGFNGHEVVIVAKPLNERVTGSVTVHWVDTSELEGMIAKAKASIANGKNPNPTEENKLRVMIAVTESVLADDTATQADVDYSTELLRKALERFQESTKTDYSKLIAAIDAANQALTNNRNPNAEAEAALRAAIEVAQRIVDDVEATQAQVDRALNALDIATKVFHRSTDTNYSLLLKAIETAKLAITNNKNPNAAAEAALKKVIDSSQALIDSGTATQQQVNAALTTLEAAIKTFQNSTRTDFTKLTATIKAANEAIANNKNPNPEAEATLRAAIALAQQVVNNANASQTEVNEAIAQLESAIAIFQEATDTDYSQLTEAINAALIAIRDNKNPNAEAEATLRAAIDAAQKLVDEGKSSQAEINQAIIDLQNAVQQFEEATDTDFTQLIALIKAAQEALANNKNPNADAESALRLVLAVAQQLVNDPNSTQEQVNSIANALEEATRNFHEATDTDFSELTALIKTANDAITSNINPNPTAEATLRAAIAIAQQVVSNVNATQVQVNQAITALQTALQTFKDSTKTDFSKLTAAIVSANQAIANNRNPNAEAEATLKAAITVAQQVANDSSASQISVDNATTTLQAAITAFQKATATDFSRLVATIDAANQAITDNKNPNPDAEANLKLVIAVAESVRRNRNASQVEVDNAVLMLETAIQEFKDATKGADSSALEAVIQKARDAIKEHGSKHPIAAGILELAINAAELVLNNIKATQEEIDIAVRTLEAAINTFLKAVGIIGYTTNTSINAV